ncbi:hypothetical protein AALA21_00505 [Eggerthellaceae bacterium 3-80]|nr:hypothetical protein D7W09_01810 [bacterium D16-34]
MKKLLTGLTSLVCFLSLISCSSPLAITDEVLDKSSWLLDISVTYCLPEDPIYGADLKDMYLGNAIPTYVLKDGVPVSYGSYEFPVYSHGKPLCTLYGQRENSTFDILSLSYDYTEEVISFHESHPNMAIICDDIGNLYLCAPDTCEYFEIQDVHSSQEGSLYIQKDLPQQIDLTKLEYSSGEDPIKIPYREHHDLDYN